MRFLARAMVLLWLVLAVWLTASVALYEANTPRGISPDILPAVVGAVVLAAVAGIAWRQERIGGWLLIAGGVLLGAANLWLLYGDTPFPEIAMSTVMPALPPLVVGSLFLRCGRPAGRQRTSGMVAAFDSVVLVLGAVLLALSVLFVFGTVASGTWDTSPWGEEPANTALWLVYAGLGVVSVGLASAALVWQARACLLQR